jgi:hypothetical protein
MEEYQEQVLNRENDPNDQVGGFWDRKEYHGSYEDKDYEQNISSLLSIQF